MRTLSPLLALPLLTLAVPGTASAQRADQSPAAARATVERYYEAIDRGDYRAAYGLWDRGGQASHQTLASFTRGFARTAQTCVIAGAPTDQEGAAGSIFITVPVTVQARLKDGTRQRFTGSYVLRHVNNIPGATPAQLTWHIESASLKPIA